jgi:hypothetical protein
MRVILFLLITFIVSRSFAQSDVASDKGFTTYDGETFKFQHPDNWSLIKVHYATANFRAPRNIHSKNDSIVIHVQFDDVHLGPDEIKDVNIDTLVARYVIYLKHLAEDFKVIDQHKVKLSEGNVYTLVQATYHEGDEPIYLYLAFKFSKAQNKISIIAMGCDPKAHDEHKDEIGHALATFVVK